MRTIANAGTARPGPFPQMAGVFAGWQNSMTFKKVTDTIEDFENVKYETSYPFEGVFQPMRSQEINFKPEGQRDWKWWTLWTRTELAISNGDAIEDFNGIRYRVIRSNNWAQGGYYQFELVQDYTAVVPAGTPPDPVGAAGGLFIENSRIILKYPDGTVAQEWDL